MELFTYNRQYYFLRFRHRDSELLSRNKLLQRLRGVSKARLFWYAKKDYCKISGVVLMRKTYDPLQDKTYMSECMKKYFEKLLRQQLEEIRRQEKLALEHLQEHHDSEPDILDRGAVMRDTVNEIKVYEHYRQEEEELEAALRRLRDGYYGYCLETGEPIGVKRLLAAPQACLSLEAQARKERSLTEK